MYNCVGMVFAVRRTWIEPEHLPLIYADDEYRIVPVPDTGDVAVYRDQSGDIQHLGVVVSVAIDIETARRNITVLSKWGGNGEYVHAVDDVPGVFGRATEFWTDRKGG
jgi:hypothetical protein